MSCVNADSVPTLQINTLVSIHGLDVLSVESLLCTSSVGRYSPIAVDAAKRENQPKTTTVERLVKNTKKVTGGRFTTLHFGYEWRVEYIEIYSDFNNIEFAPAVVPCLESVLIER